MHSSVTVCKAFQVLVASLFVVCLFAFWPALAAGKGGGGASGVHDNPAKRGTANSLSTAGTAGATKGAAGGRGTRPSPNIKGESKDKGHDGWISD